MSNRQISLIAAEPMGILTHSGVTSVFLFCFACAMHILSKTGLVL